MKLQKLLSYTRKAVDEYQMIEEGDHIAAALYLNDHTAETLPA